MPRKTAQIGSLIVFVLRDLPAKMDSAKAWRAVQGPAKTVRCAAKGKKHKFVPNNPVSPARFGIPFNSVVATKFAKMASARAREDVHQLVRKMRSVASKIPCRLVKILRAMGVFSGERQQLVGMERSVSKVTAPSHVRMFATLVRPAVRGLATRLV